MKAHKHRLWLALLACSLLACTPERQPADTSTIHPALLQAIRQAETFNDLMAVDTLYLEIPFEHTLGNISDLQEDSRGNLIAADRGYTNTVLKFSPQGTFLRKIGTYGSGPGEYRHPNFLAVNSRDEIIVLDNQLRRITYFDSLGAYLHDFGFKDQATDLAVLPTGELLLHRRDDWTEINKTIRLLSPRGKVLKRFGRRSAASHKMIGLYPYAGAGPYLACNGEAIHESDFANFRVRKYLRREDYHWEYEFGQQPPEWRSLTTLDIKNYITASAPLPEIAKVFYEKYETCSMIKHIMLLDPAVLAVQVYNGGKSGFSTRLSYDLYDASSGSLLRAGLALTGYPFDEQEGPHTEIKVAKPSTLYFIQYVESRHELDQEFRLIRFRLREELRGNARVGG